MEKVTLMFVDCDNSTQTVVTNDRIRIAMLLKTIKDNGMKIVRLIVG